MDTLELLAQVTPDRVRSIKLGAGGSISFMSTYWKVSRSKG
jgi:hypothetical protein